jgi:lipoyl(octanoyl) transferase
MNGPVDTAGRRRSVDAVSELHVIRAGLLPYQDAWRMQRELHEARVADTAPDTVLLLQHPPVYTAGKRTEPWERPLDGAPVIEVDRGGKITWHGPGQLVGYPIVKLPRPLDVVAYVRRMEQLLSDVCAEFGLSTMRVPGRTGVWLPADADRPQRKVAAIGIRVSRRVTLHGFALNCDADLSWFDRIVPCGINDAGVTSISAELERNVAVADVLPVIERRLPTLLDTKLTTARSSRQLALRS